MPSGKKSKKKASAMRKAFFVFLATSFALVFTVAMVAYSFSTYPDKVTGTAEGTVQLEVPRGATARSVAELLAEKGLLEDPTWFRIYAGQRGVASRFKAGRYKIEAPKTPRELIALMVKGVADELVTVTVPEGKNMIEVAELLAAAKVADKDALIAKATDPAFAAELGLPGKSVEGYLYPDTYKLRPGTDPEKVLLSLVRRHREVFEELRIDNEDTLSRLKKKLGWNDPEFVIMASIVEKETGQSGERPRIAQVFINRLLMPSFQPKLLQTDPTIVYGCQVAPLFLGEASAACKQFKDRIRRIHLQDQDNPYSTYAHPGLPPGPIANPGRAALEAVMNPDRSKFLYFVSRNDGTHKFSATRAEHDAAVVKFQRGGKPLASRKPKAKPN